VRFGPRLTSHAQPGFRGRSWPRLGEAVLCVVRAGLLVGGANRIELPGQSVDACSSQGSWGGESVPLPGVYRARR
jgi:hypothetical protein